MSTRSVVDPTAARAESSGLAGASVDHVGFYVADLDSAVTSLTAGYGFDVLIPATHSNDAGDHLSALLGLNRIRLLLTQAISQEHPAFTYIQQHGDGVADIALRLPDVRSAYAGLIDRGATPVHPPQDELGCVTATVAGFGDVVHTLIERRPDIPADRIPGLPDPHPVTDRDSVGLLNVDHFAICVPVGDLATTSSMYRDVFDMPVIFEEKIEVGPMGMESTVVQSDSGDVTFTLIQPAPNAEAGQIESFLTEHGGPGVQHVAFATDDAVHTISTMRERGVAFLSEPAGYYEKLSVRLTPLRHMMDQLRELHILADEDHDGQLFQIFTRSAHPRGTFFFEVIERIRARSFGSNNIRALFEAVELQRSEAREMR